VLTLLIRGSNGQGTNGEWLHQVCAWAIIGERAVPDPCQTVGSAQGSTGD